MTISISRSAVKALIENTAEGKIFTVDFIKADGTPRTMNARLGVTAALAVPVAKGDNKANRLSDTTFKHRPNLLGVYEMAKNAYRCINIDTMTRLALNGVTYEVVA
jgi:hypothetical protein